MVDERPLHSDQPRANGAAVDRVVLRRVERCAATMQAQPTRSRPHDDPVAVVEAHVVAAQLADDVEDRLVVDEVTKTTRCGEVTDEALAHDVGARLRHVQQVDGDVQCLDVALRQDARAHQEPEDVEAIALLRSHRASVVGMFDGVEEGIDIVVFTTDQPDGEPVLVVLVGLVVLPRQHALDAVTIDGDVGVLVDDRRDNGQLHFRLRWLIFQDLDEFTDAHERTLVHDSANQPGAWSSRKRLTSLQRSRVSQNGVSSPSNTSARSTGMRAIIDRLRSGASVTLANESVADTSTGKSNPPTPAISVANTNRSGGSGNGGRVHVNNKGKVKPRGGSASGSSCLMTSSSKPSNARGSTSNDRCRSMGPLHASSGCRSTSHNWRREYVSTK